MNIILYQPYARIELLFTFKDLANKEQQLKEWTDPRISNAYWYNLCDIVLDDMYFDNYLYFCLKGSSITSIGCFLYDEEEVEAIDTYMIFLNKLVEEIGDDQHNEVYLNHPQWPLVWEGAEKIVRLMECKNIEYDFEVSRKVIKLYPELLEKAGRDRDQAARDELERLGYRLLIPRDTPQVSAEDSNVTR